LKLLRRTGVLLLILALASAPASQAAGYGRVLEAGFPLSLLTSRSPNLGYLTDGYLARREGPEDPAMVTHAAQVMEKVYATLLADSDARCYLAVIPGKDCLVRGELDYTALTEDLYRQTPHLTPIPVDDLLDLGDYYRTDDHWRQEAILDVADRLADAMGTTLTHAYQAVTCPDALSAPLGPALTAPWPAEDLVYLQSFLLESVQGKGYTMGGEETLLPVYDLAALETSTPYDLFLGGAQGILTLENPEGPDRQLILFRDSFGSSLAPLLLSGYRTITLVDLRYLPSLVLDRFLEVQEGADVLFLYSTLVVNHSLALR
jgi:hypothetical protein